MRSIVIERPESEDGTEAKTPLVVEEKAAGRVTPADQERARAVEAYWARTLLPFREAELRSLRRARWAGGTSEEQRAAALDQIEVEIADLRATARLATDQEIATARQPTKGGQRMAGLGEWLQGVALVEMVAEDMWEVVMRTRRGS